jgi:hypothetical protein
LKTSGINEAVVFADHHTAFDVFVQLEKLDPKVALRWIMPGDLSSRWVTALFVFPRMLSSFYRPDTTESIQQRVWVRLENASNVQIPNAGHLVRSSRMSHNACLCCAETDSSRGPATAWCVEYLCLIFRALIERQALDLDAFFRRQYEVVKANL